MAFRPLPIGVAFVDNENIPLANGTIEFLSPGTTTPKDVYAEQGLTTNLGNVITLNTAGRPATAVWVSGAVRIRWYDQDGNLIDEEDPVNDPTASGGLSIPTVVGHPDEFLSNNGVDLVWTDIIQFVLPSMVGKSGQVLSNDGADALWKTLADLGMPAFTNTGGTRNITIGDFLIQWGTDTFPIPSVTPPHGADKVITFPVAFASAPAAFVTANKINIASSGFRAVTVGEPTATNLSVNYNINENTLDPGADVATTIPFSWLAIGTKA